MKYKNLHGVVDELRNAVKAHGKQANTIEKHIDKMKGDGPPKLDPMYNNKPGVQKEDFEQFNSPMSKKAKGMDGKACWKGYKLQGTKMKGGKRVDNCVKM